MVNAWARSLMNRDSVLEVFFACPVLLTSPPQAVRVLTTPCIARRMTLEPVVHVPVEVKFRRKYLSPILQPATLPGSSAVEDVVGKCVSRVGLAVTSITTKYVVLAASGMPMADVYSALLEPLDHVGFVSVPRIVPGRLVEPDDRIVTVCVGFPAVPSSGMSRVGEQHVGRGSGRERHREVMLEP